MFKISKAFSFCYGHRLLNDPGKCKNLHGHTAKIVIELSAPGLDQNGMVAHFDHLKKTVGRWIENELDHSMLLSRDDPIAAVLKQADEKIVILDKNPTAENIAKMVFDKAVEFGLPVESVEVWESEASKAKYAV
jgi:6-pyruvoyltetrahydropterin/6-carboxytetrahydropterin synthase